MPTYNDKFKKGDSMESETLSYDRMAHGIGQFEEQFAPELQGLAKSITRVSRFKKIERQSTLMNLVDLRKQLDEVRRLAQEMDDLGAQLQERLGGYRLAVSEDDQLEWQARFKAAFGGGYPPVEGDFPTFKIFPIEVRVDFEHELVMVNNRTIRTIHPEAIAAAVQKEWDRLNGERFNADSFVRALLRAYDLVIAEQQVTSQGRNQSGAVPILKLHEVLTLKTGMSGYPKNQFAYDIYRLRRSESLTRGHRKLDFGKTRDRGAIVITLPSGAREIIGSLEVVSVSDE